MANQSAYWGVAIAFAGVGFVFLLTGNSTAWVFLPLGVVFIALAVNNQSQPDNDDSTDD